MWQPQRPTPLYSSAWSDVYKRQVVRHPENARVGCLAEDQGAWRSGRPGWGDNRAVRGEPARQPVPTVESHVVWVILSWAGSDGGNTEAGRDENPGHT